MDWERAFDKIDHEALFAALERLDIDPHIVEVLKNCYSHPTFFVQDDYSKSDTKKTALGHQARMPHLPLSLCPCHGMH